MLKVRNIIIGNGIPKIIVPLVGGSDAELIDEVRHVMNLEPDIVEWRVDTYDHVEDFTAVHFMLVKLRDLLGNTPLLFTFRSFQEGGKSETSVTFYQELIMNAIENKLIDLVDIELFLGDVIVKKLVAIAKKNNIYVVLSNHEFHKTPDKEEIVNRLRNMQELGADIPKIAVMPNSTQDVVTLLDATNTMKDEYADRPFITISMGEKGLVTRLSGGVFGSAATFGAGREASAPGQLDAKELRRTLELFHPSHKL